MLDVGMSDCYKERVRRGYSSGSNINSNTLQNDEKSYFCCYGTGTSGDGR